MYSPRKPIAVLTALLLLSACAPSNTPPVTGASPAATATPGGAPSPSAPAASAAPSATPTTAPSTMPSSPPSASPSITPSPAGSVQPSAAAFDLTRGKMLRKYDFQGIGGLYYDFSQDQLWVIDDVDKDETQRGFVARRFLRDGTFDSTVELHRESEKAPEAVDGMAFDLVGVPAFTYEFDDAFSLRRLYTATVEEAKDLPSATLERAGIAALASQANIFSLGVIRLDPDVTYDYDTADREILYIRAEEEQDPEAIFRVPDPFEPTSRMAMSPDGVLYLFGGTPGGGLGVKRLDKTQALVDLPIPLSRMPDHVWTAPNGDVLLGEETTGNTPARIRRFSPTGAPVGETELRLADGRVVFDLAGLAFDGRGHVVIAGTAIASDLTTATGLFEFD